MDVSIRSRSVQIDSLIERVSGYSVSQPSAQVSFRREGLTIIGEFPDSAITRVGSWIPFNLGLPGQPIPHYLIPPSV